MGGFSQGGHVAIDVAMNCAVRGAFSINGNVLPCTRTSSTHKTRLVAFNGEDDDIVDAREAQENLRRLKGPRLSLRLLKGGRHGIPAEGKLIHRAMAMLSSSSLPSVEEVWKKGDWDTPEEKPKQGRKRKA